MERERQTESERTTASEDMASRLKVVLGTMELGRRSLVTDKPVSMRTCTCTTISYYTLCGDQLGLGVLGEAMLQVARVSSNSQN